MKPYIQKTKTKYCLPVSIDKQTTVTFLCLKTDIEYRSISALLNANISAVGINVCNTSYMCYHSTFINLYIILKCPVRTESEKLYESLKLWGFPQVVGVLDNTHILFLKPTKCPSGYYNRKGLYSILIQGVMNS